MNKNVFEKNARGLVFSVVAALPVLFSACNKSGFSSVSPDGDGPVSVTEIKIQEGTSLSLISGETKQLMAEVLPANASDKEVLWSSDADNIATVTAEGLLTAKGIGSATITVTTKDGNKTVRLQVTVKPIPVLEVKILEGPALTLNTGETKQLTVEVLPAKATDKKVSWSSNAPNIASITAEGLLTVKGVGSAIITVTTRDGNKTKDLVITVKPVAVTGVRILEVSPLTLNPRDTKQLTAEVLPDNATNKYTDWSSDNSNVAVVSDGLVRAVSPGNATITVTTRDGNHTATLDVTVTAIPVAVTGIRILEGPALALNTGDTKQLTAELLPAGATDKVVIWNSSNGGVASVDGNGLVRAVSSGNATITIMTRDGNKTATSKVTVYDSMDSVYTSDKPYNLTIVYFVPSEFKAPLPDYKRRISEFLSYQQDYTLRWMRAWNLGDKTFGLRKNRKGEVEINVVYGKYPTEFYPYNGGDTAIEREVTEWFKAHPDKRASEHVFILTANLYDGKSLPFYGYSRRQIAFGIDYPYMELKNMSSIYNRFNWNMIQEQASWVGANYHEMLHGLGISHDGGLVSQRRANGPALMGTNGGGFYTDMTYITQWDCALLSIGQTFNTTIRTDWYQPAGSRITRLNARYDDNPVGAGKIIVSGKFTSNKKVLYVGFTNDAKRNSTDRDYDSENWIAIPTDTDNDGIADSFSTEMSIDEFDADGKVDNIPVTFRVTFFHENGTREGHDYSYRWINGKPDIQFGNKP